MELVGIGRVCAAVVFATAALTGCGDSGPDEPAVAAPVTDGPTTSPVATLNAPTSTAAARPNPSHASHPAASPSHTVVPTPQGATRAELGKDFRLEEGQFAFVKGARLVVTFTRLVSDSRCPTNVTCIQAGEATIAIKVTGPDEPQSFELSTPGPNEKRLGKFVVQLRAVEPYPTDPAGSSRTDVPKVAVLRVVKQG